MKKMFAAVLAASIALSAMPAMPVFAVDTTVTCNPVELGEESTTTVTTEAATEAYTEKPTEAPTQAVTEASTQAVTEAPTQATTAASVTQAVTEKPVETTTKYTSPIQEGKPHEANIHVTATIKGKYSDGDTDYIYAEDYMSIDPETLDWSSENNSIASVDHRGRITPKAPGHTVITGKGYINFNFHVQVIESAEDSRDITLYEDEKTELGKYVKGDPEDYDWTSDDHSIVTVDDYGTARSKEKDGHVVITAENERNSAIYKFYIRVRQSSDNHPAEHNFIEEDMPLYMGTGDSADVSMFLDKAPESYKWYSDNTSVARVDAEKGTITARNEGKTTVHAHGTHYDYCFNVDVNDDYSIDSREMKIGDTFDYDRYIDSKINDAEAYSFKGYILDVYGSTVEAKTKGAGYVVFKSPNNEIHQLLINVKADSSKHTVETTTEAVTEAASVNIQFTDIAHRPWAKGAIENMAASGFISGRGNGIFAPDDGCTRADFTIVLVRMLGLDNMAPSGNYADVPADAYYYNYVSIAKNNGLAAGVDGDNFRPAQNITREEIMAMVYNGLALKGVQMNIQQSVLGRYSDGALVSPQYWDAVSALLNMGAVQGTSATTIDPKSNVTRAQMAVLLNNVYESILK